MVRPRGAVSAGREGGWARRPPVLGADAESVACLRGARTGYGMRFSSRLPRGVAATGIGAALAVAGAGRALAQAATQAMPDCTPPAAGEALGAPTNWGMGLQASGGIIKDCIHDFNTLVFWIITVITIFVLALLIYCVWRFREDKNPNPSRTSHHTMLEIAWTVIPVLILVVIAIPSFRLIYFQDRATNADLTINVQGRQWYWHYQFPDHGNFAFDSRPMQDDEIRGTQLRSLSVDEPLVIPVGRNIRIITTGQDVIHSFFIPSLGVQRYSIPGRSIETWMRADRPGTFYGQCNQICGTNHWFMPIEVRAVPQEQFDTWAREARTRFAAAPGPAETIAAAPAAADTVQIAAARR